MKRYGIFISSPKKSLERERNTVINAVLRLGFLPICMEFFPSSARKTWAYIQKAIDDSDYYILILDTIYGSVEHENNQSYTEREYRYAVEKKIPTIAFLKADIEKVPLERFDNREKLLSFHRYVAGRSLVLFWKNKQLLTEIVMPSLIQLMSDYPRHGLVRSNETFTDQFNHPASQFLFDNISKILAKPYRENLEARVEYQFADNRKYFYVLDKVSYKCRSINGSISRSITWSVHESELNDFEKISISIQKPNGESQIVLNQSKFETKLIDHEYIFNYNIDESWNIDNLLVIIETSYFIPIDHFISWEMPILTYQFTLTITFPKALKIFFVPYMLNYKNRDMTEWNGFSSYKFFDWIIENEGLAWQFRRKSNKSLAVNK